MHVNRIRELMESSSTSRTTLARALQMHPATLDKYLHARQAIPSDVLMELCELFCVTPTYLLGYTDDPEGEGSITYSGWSLSADEVDLVQRHREDPDQTMSAREFELVRCYRELGIQWKGCLLAMAHGASENVRLRTRDRAWER